MEASLKPSRPVVTFQMSPLKTAACGGGRDTDGGTQTASPGERECHPRSLPHQAPHGGCVPRVLALSPWDPRQRPLPALERLLLPMSWPLSLTDLLENGFHSSLCVQIAWWASETTTH